MRILLLHSDVAPDAPPDEQDTIVTAGAVAEALEARGHAVRCSAFSPEPKALDLLLGACRTDVVFNLVESVFGQGDLAGLAPAMLAQRNIPFTGAFAAALACTSDKPLTKKILRAAGLPTPDWSEAPHWDGLAEGRSYVVKSATEDSSVGLDDGAVVQGPDAVRRRAEVSAKRHGGTWFAEAYCPGREFNVSILQEGSDARVLPIAEIEFSDWKPDRPQIVGYSAKWDEASSDCAATGRVFGLEETSAELASTLARLSLSAWHLLGQRGYSRVDFRLDPEGGPTILEINPNPCLERGAGFAAAALRAGISYAELVERIVEAAVGA
jgi:D-alanine-D-alanine ligase